MNHVMYRLNLFSTLLCIPLYAGVPETVGSRNQIVSDDFPSIQTKPNTNKKAVGEEVTLWCSPQNTGKYVVLWKKGDNDVLTAGSMMIKPDSRISLVEYNLRIKDVRPEDAGQYTCYVSTNGPAVSVTHNLQILVPARVKAEPEDGGYVVKRGKSAELRCSVTGNPVPDVRWSRKDGGFLGDGVSSLGESLMIHSVTKESAGVYVCTASNGVGVPDRAEIQLEVLYAPEIDLETEKLHTGEDKEAHLTCIVHGNPKPQVHWYRGPELLVEGRFLGFSIHKDRYTLILRRIRSGLDFGNYSCVAENSMGSFKRHIEVHGRPTSPVFRSKPNTSKDTEYILSWSVDSYSPIEEHRLLYRKIKAYHGPVDSRYPMGEGDWNNVVIPGDLNNIEFTHFTNYRLTGLREESEYECLVQARNRFGWSEPSRLFTFFTSKPALPSHDLSWSQALNVASSLNLRAPTSALLVALMFVFLHQGCMLC